MSLRDKLAEARERERQAREAGEALMRRISKAAQLRALGVPVPGGGGQLDPSLTEDALDQMLAAEQNRRAELFETFARTGTVTIFRALGVQILKGDDKVYTLGVHDSIRRTNSSRLLGALAGAQATVTAGTPAFSLGKAMIMPIATAPLARKETADGMIVFADGTVHSVALDGSSAVREARKACVEFNARAVAAAPAVASTGSDPAAKIRKLQELRAADLISQEEYEAKRAEVINSF